MSKIKLVATDIDGTLLRCDLGFTPQIKKCIKNLCEKGIKVVLVTGRMHSATTQIADELGLKTPIVSYQGGMIKDGANCENTLYEKTLSPELARQIIKWAHENDVHLNLYMDDVLYVENDSSIIREYAQERFIEYKVCDFDKVKIENINKILAIKYDDAETVTEWVNFLSIKFPDLYVVKSTPYFCEISHKEATKACAVDFLRKHWGLSKDEILTIGDQNNDIELLKAGGIKIAMGNATEELKACADYVTDTVENNGWVKAIEKFVG